MLLCTEANQITALLAVLFTALHLPVQITCSPAFTSDHLTAALQKRQAGAVRFRSEKLLKLTKQTPPELAGPKLFKGCHGSRGCVAEKSNSTLEACTRLTGGGRGGCLHPLTPSELNSRGNM